MLDVLHVQLALAVLAVVWADEALLVTGPCNARVVLLTSAALIKSER